MTKSVDCYYHFLVYKIKNALLEHGESEDFRVSPNPLGTNWVFELIRTLVGQGLGGFGTRA